MNSGFRNLLGRRDTTRFKAYLLAIAVQMLLLPILHRFGWIQFTVPGFYPLGAVTGGFLFGMAMNWGGGCPAGVWYKLGGGSIGAFVAIMGMIVGYSATESGILRSMREWIQSVGNNGNLASLTLPSLTNIPLLWLTLPLSLGLLVSLFRSSPQQSFSGWHWRKTGLWIGGIGVIAWVLSSLTGRYFGMAILPGSKNVLNVFAGDRQAENWDLFFVLGIPMGGYLATRGNGSFKWSTISGAAIWRLAAGGFVLGVSASLAGGCTVGHGLAGIPLLSAGSITFTLFAILGAWAGVIFEKHKGTKTTGG